MILKLRSAHDPLAFRHEAVSNVNYVVEHLPEDGCGPRPGTWTLPWLRREDEMPLLLDEPLERFLELPGFVLCTSTEWFGRRVAVNTANVARVVLPMTTMSGVPTVEVVFFEGYPANVESYEGILPEDR